MLTLLRPHPDSADERPLLEFLGKAWPAQAASAEAERAAGGLLALGLTAGERLGLLLPNLPVTVIALVAAWRAGLVAAPVDPRQAPEALRAWQRAVRPAALVTLDLATVYERAVPLLDDPALRFVIVARMATQLSPLKRVLSPWLRAGGVARPRYDARMLRWEALAGRAPHAGPAPEDPALLLPDGTQRTHGQLAGLARDANTGRRLLARPLADETSMAALLASHAGGGTLVLSPRLDERSLAKVAAAARTTERVE